MNITECPEFTLSDCINIVSHGASQQRLLELGLNFDVLCEMYKLQYDQMIMFKYTLQQWLELGMCFDKHCRVRSATLIFLYILFFDFFGVQALPEDFCFFLFGMNKEALRDFCLKWEK